ncbi:hypothetical protein ANN_01829 [Periplaneta americana]|uniref:Uncharacterized protein n=1 Tax=Periplaneta americana TaxID=6978 RepID=A0ABQ8TYQ8_PERAM|nr:hypothetical protein ANN_01829 [Periplaneta americana]
MFAKWSTTMVRWHAVIQFLVKEEKSAAEIHFHRANGFEAGYLVLMNSDLAPSDYHLFGSIKEQLRGQRYEMLEDIQKAVRHCLREDETDFYSTGIFKLTERRGKCVERNGDYVQSDRKNKILIFVEGFHFVNICLAPYLDLLTKEPSQPYLEQDAFLHALSVGDVLSTTVPEFPAFLNIFARIHSLRALPRALRLGRAVGMDPVLLCELRAEESRRLPLGLISHHRVRASIAQILQQRGWEMHVEVHCLSVKDFSRRADIIALKRNENIGLVLDPTIRFERNTTQAEEVNFEKKSIYEPCLSFLSEKYKIPINQWIARGLLFGARGILPKFTGDVLKSLKINFYEIQEIVIKNLTDSLHILLIGARGVIPKFFESFRKTFELPQTLTADIITSVLKRSCQILSHHIHPV